MCTSRTRLFLLLLSIASFAGAANRPASSAEGLPPAAQTSLSAALGSKDSRYQVHRTKSGLEADSPTQKLSAYFTPRGAELRCGDLRWNLSLLDYGRGKSLQPVHQAAPHAIGNRVEYQRGLLTEWYMSGPAGIEQGFTLQRAPAPAQSQPLTFRLAASGDLSPSINGDRSGLQLKDSTGQIRWLYAGLSARDAAGKDLLSWIELADDKVLLRVNDEGAVYPIVVDPIVQMAQLTNAQATAGSFWGYSIAMSGNILVVGAPNTTLGNNTDQGAVYVFVEPPSGWANMTQTAVLTASDGQLGDSLGTSVAIANNTIVAGAPQAGTKKTFDLGAVYVFVQPSGGWANMTQNAKLVASDGVTNSSLGSSVSISGNTVVAGAPFQLGTVYVFVEPNSGWSGNLTQNAELTATGADVSGLGSAVWIDGNTIAAGAERSNVNGNFQQGAVYVFVEGASGWTNGNQAAELTASDGQTFDELGTAVALNSNVIIAGAPNASVNGNVFQGAAYIFVKPAAGWGNATETAKLTSSDGASNDSFAFSVAIRQGAIVLCGAPGAAVNSNFEQGAAYVYVRPPGGWQNTSQFFAKITNADGVAGSQAGTAVVISPISGVGAMTAPGSTVGTNAFEGAAYVYGQHP